MSVENDKEKGGVKLRTKLRKLGVLLGLLLTFWLLEVAIASAAPLSCQTTRVFGDTCIETGIYISQIGWQQAGTVLFARTDDVPDSLVSVPLSHRLNAPILLTYPAQLEPPVLTEIERLGAKHGFISNPIEEKNSVRQFFKSRLPLGFTKNLRL
ncbi:MAG: cell wall-binding repeat-containing protein [Desulfosporosinus sp.]|nr:cell wall-binding repeat-containing protein [Desulfosporosinus sp.]